MNTGFIHTTVSFNNFDHYSLSPTRLHTLHSNTHSLTSLTFLTVRAKRNDKRAQASAEVVALYDVVACLTCWSGGYIVNVTRVEHLDKCSDYVGRLQPLMRRLEDEGKWKSVSSSTFPNFLRGKEGLVLVHQVL